MKYWTSTEEETLRQLATYLTRTEIAERLGRSYNSVNQKILLMGITTKMSKVGRKCKSVEHLKETQKRKHARYYERHKEERKEYQRKYYIALKEDEEAYSAHLQKIKERRYLTKSKALYY